MMLYRFARFVIFYLLAFCWHGAVAQNAPDSTKIDTVRNKYLPTGLRIGTDILSLVRTRTQDNFHGWEVNGEIDFSRYFLTIEYGTWGRNLNSDSAAYANTGDYWRAG